MKFLPLYDKIVIKHIDTPLITRGGIHLASTNEDPITKANVFAVGEGLRDHGEEIPLKTKVGDVILIHRGIGVPVTIEDEKYLIVQERDVLGIL